MNSIRRFKGIKYLVASLLVFTLFFLLTAPVKPASANLILNPSVETASSSTVPQSWLQGGWGTNTRTLTYLNNGHNSDHSLKVEITNYTNGDVKWYFNPVAVTPGHQYSFSDYYQSSVASSLVAMYKNSSGSLSYQTLESLAASPTDWAQSTINFTAPADTASVSIFHLINRVGWLQTDDFSLTDISSTPATPPSVSITSPASGDNLSGTYGIAANAGDLAGIASVQFKIDGNNLGPADTTPPYSYDWDTTTVSNGSHTLTAVATNVNDLSTTSDPVTINVSNQTTPPPAGSNLIANPSVESADSANSSLPQGWLQGGWGTSTRNLSYPSTGRTGSRSVKVQITSYTSGDVKWYFTPVDVTAGQEYTFTDYYQSDITNELVAQYSTASGYSYVSLGTQPASNAWNQSTVVFTVPSNATKLTIFHLIKSVGWLETDDYSLLKNTATPPPPPPTSNLIPNPSVENVNESNSNLPQNWKSSKWGTNTTTFSYLNDDGHTGTHSLRTQITGYTSGASNWYFSPQPIVPNQQYDFKDFYKSNVIAEIDAAIDLSDGTTKYVYLGSTYPSPTDWTEFDIQFTAPANAVSVSIYHTIYSVGWLQTDDFSLTPYQEIGFNRPIISLTFDDGWASYFNNGLPILDKYNFPATDFIISGYLGSPKYMTGDQIKQLYADGHEIGSHTVDHTDLTTLSTTALNSELQGSQATLQALLGVPVTDFATPYGAYNQVVLNYAAKYYQSHRSVEAGFNAKSNFDIYNIKVQNMLSTTTLAQVQAWVDKAKTTNTWLVLVYHQVDPTIAKSANAYNTYPSDLDAQLAYIQSTGVAVETVQQALDEITPQL